MVARKLIRAHAFPFLLTLALPLPSAPSNVPLNPPSTPALRFAFEH